MIGSWANGQMYLVQKILAISVLPEILFLVAQLLGLVAWCPNVIAGIVREQMIWVI
jgi:hypothetical protein